MTPLYIKVKTHILDQIRSGTFKTGSRVPSENELVTRFKISRMTANRALNELTAEGHLARVPGVGTFVKETTPRSSLLELRNIADEITARGHRYSSRIEHVGEVTATPNLIEDFEFKSATQLFHIVIVHEENGMPVQLEDRFVNPFCAPQFLKQNLFDLVGIKNIGYHYPIAQHDTIAIGYQNGKNWGTHQQHFQQG